MIFIAKFNDEIRLNFLKFDPFGTKIDIQHFEFKDFVFYKPDNMDNWDLFIKSVLYFTDIKGDIKLVTQTPRELDIRTIEVQKDFQ